MEISNAHHQAMASHQLEEVLGGGCSKTQQQERKVKPQPEQALKCPRCESTNTKFCYYNNYSLSQPRYFCKGCRRYWTQGGSLRNVPVGGGCRKNKRCSSSSSSSKKAQDQALTTNSSPLLSTLPPLSYDPSDLTLAFARLHKQSNPDAPFLLGNPNPSHISTVPTGTGFLDILRSGFLDTNTPSGFHNLYNGFGASGSVGEAEGGMLPFEGGLGGSTTTTTATTVEAGEVSGRGFCKSMDGGENKVAMGLQWQAGGDGNNMAVDSARDYWNGLGSYWHGLINSSLM